MANVVTRRHRRQSRLSLPEIRVRPSAHGLGVFAGCNIAPGETIMFLDGPTISFDEAVSLGDKESYALQIGYSFYLHIAAPGCLVNHSCSPNAGILDDRRLVALRTIKENEEIRYDYSTTMDENYWTMPCSCGSSLCRHVVEDFCRLPKHVRARYLRQGIVQEFIRHQYNHNGARLNNPKKRDSSNIQEPLP